MKVGLRSKERREKAISDKAPILHPTKRNVITGNSPSIKNKWTI